MQCTVVAAGDFNFLASGDSVFRPEVVGGAPRRPERADRPGQIVLAALSSRMVDITDGVRTHYCSALNSFSRLDRILVSLPPWLLANLHVKATTEGDPQRLLAAGISDHAPVRVIIAPRAALP